jgi:hypothetical protein
MSNPFTVAEQDLVKAGSFLIGLTKKAVSVFDSSKSTQTAAVALLSSVETLISLAAPAVGASGLNFAADSAAYAQFLVVVADAKAFVAAAEPLVKEL